VKEAKQVKGGYDKRGERRGVNPPSLFLSLPFLFLSPLLRNRDIPPKSQLRDGVGREPKSKGVSSGLLQGGDRDEVLPLFEPSHRKRVKGELPLPYDSIGLRGKRGWFFQVSPPQQY